MNEERRGMTQPRRVVIKVGTNLVSSAGGGLNTAFLTGLVDGMAQMLGRGTEGVLVSSGAVGSGREWLEWRRELTELSDRQALAAVGQPLLMKAYADLFGRHDLKTAQVLLTREGLENRERYLNARRTLESLLRWGVVPIVNENDTVVTEELQFGDNDRLAAVVAGKLQSDLLILLTDVETVWDAERRPVRRVDQITPELFEAAGGPSNSRSRGGMRAKLSAVREAMVMGVCAVIASGNRPGILESILDVYPTMTNLGEAIPEEAPGSWFVPPTSGLTSRKRWILGCRTVRGTLVIDRGAQRALEEGKKSLLPSGVSRVEGSFEVGDPISIESEERERIGQGLANLSSEELSHFRGMKTDEIREKIDRDIGSCVAVHKDNLVLFRETPSSSPSPGASD